MTEKMLTQAFELQRFVQNPRLQRVIDQSHARLAARELSDEDLDLVAGGKDLSGGQPQTAKKPGCQ